MRLFHYHLVTSMVRPVEERYLAKLGFELVARYGYLGEEVVGFEPGFSWEDLDARGFRLRLVELQRGAVNVVVQPGQWELPPRVDHVGIALEDEPYLEVIGRATMLGRGVQQHGGRRTFVATEAGYRLEIHPRRDWIDELLARDDVLALRELRLRAEDPERKALALAELLGLEPDDGSVAIGDAVVTFTPGGPKGRPELEAELFG
ncbi:MAG: hypothetical protein ABR521_02815 [Gaiellaceae bacterium]